ISTGAVTWNGQKFSGARARRPSATKSCGRFVKAGGCFRRHGAQMIFFVILMGLVFVAQIVEFFIPPLDWMYNAHIYITPMLVFYGAMALPFPLVLVLAFWAGFLLDTFNAHVVCTHVVISLVS